MHEKAEEMLKVPSLDDIVFSLKGIQVNLPSKSQEVCSHSSGKRLKDWLFRARQLHAWISSYHYNYVQ